MEEKPTRDAARGKFRQMQGGISADASVASWERHQKKRGGDERAARLRKLLKGRPAGLWAEAGPAAALRVPPPQPQRKVKPAVAAGIAAAGAAGAEGGARKVAAL